MSTDDLTARVRDHLAHADTLPHGLAIALVSELADEVDRLRGERDRWKARSVTAGADLDAARAALERVRAVGAVIADECAHHEDREGETPALRVSGGWRDVSDYAQDITRALEGEPS